MWSPEEEKLRQLSPSARTAMLRTCGSIQYSTNVSPDLNIFGNRQSATSSPNDNDSSSPQDTATKEESDLHPSRSKWSLPISVFFKNARHVFRMDALGREILRIAFPAVLVLAANRATSFIDTAFIRHLGPVEFAAASDSIFLFNQAVNIFTFPLTTVTASLVAKNRTLGKTCANLVKNESINEIEMEESRHDDKSDVSLEIDGQSDLVSDNEIIEMEEPELDDEIIPAEDFTATTCSKEREYLSSTSTSLVVAGILGILLPIFLAFGAKTLLDFTGVRSAPIQTSARSYLRLRSIGAPAILLSNAMQGMFQGFKDTRTPLYATVAGNLANIALDSILIFVCKLGARGATVAHVSSQYLIFLILLWRLTKKVYILPPSIKDIDFRQFIKKGFFVLARVITLTTYSSFAAYLVARLGSTFAAANEACLMVWTISLFTANGLAIAGQAILASGFAKKDYDKATAAASRLLQMGVVLGLGLAAIVSVFLRFGTGLLSKDVNVQHLIFVGIPFVAATQAITSLAFVSEGVIFGSLDFAYSAYSMILVSIVSIGSLFLLYKSDGFVGIWGALIIHMTLRTLAGIWRLGSGTGPWRFLRE